jgi:histone acetyltransferase (RNA polymerase elongator complex component)
MGPVIVPFFISHKGCPHRCVFCDQKRITGSAGEIPSEADILDTIAEGRKSAGSVPVEVAFYGGTFTGLPRDVQERLLRPLQPLIRSGGVVSVRVSTRPDAIDPEATDFLSGMGVGTVELGVQSMDDEVLSLAGRGHTAADTVSACRTLKEAGMKVGIQLMPGLPGDDTDRALASMDRVVGLFPDFIRIYPALVIAGTRLAELYQCGEYLPLDLEGALLVCKVMLHRAIASGVRVIRIGLQATAELDSGAVLAGPYHPAFRQLVEADLFYDLIAKLAGGGGIVSPLAVFCSPSRVSDVIGQRRGNLRRLERERGVRVEEVRGDPAFSTTELAVASGKTVKRGDILRDLEYRGGALS